MVVFATFGDARWKDSVKRIRHEAWESGFFGNFLCYNERDLSDEFLRYAKRNPRGYGFWRWKHIICGCLMEKLDFGDYLVYADAGCTINPHGDMGRWLEIADENDMVSFQLHYSLTERKYTKAETIEHLNAERFVDTPQLMSTTFVAKKTERTRELFYEAWKCSIKSPHIYDDYTENEDPAFIDHRHDQSVFSLLRKTHGFKAMPDETYHDGRGNYDQTVPIWATRRQEA